jgi:hypothetical protein
MATAQFVGPTGSEQSQNAMTGFMGGMNQLAQFGQFATEQNRLNKVEKIKNTVNEFLLRAEREGGGPGKEYLGIKKIAEDTPEYYQNFLETIEMDSKLAKETVAFLSSDAQNWEEGSKAFSDSLYKLVGKTPSAADQGASGPSASQVPSAGAAAPAASTPSGGEALNLNEWDKTVRGDYGKEAQSAAMYAFNMGLSPNVPLGGSYKDLLGKLGISPEDQGEVGKPRMMYFTSGIADKLLADARLTPEQKAQVQKDKATYTQAISTVDAARKTNAPSFQNFNNLTPEQQAAGPVHANLQQPVNQQVVVTPGGSVTSRGATAPAAAGGSDEAFWNYMQSDPKIGSWKGMSYADAKASGRDKKLIAVNPGKYETFMASQKTAGAAVSLTPQTVQDVVKTNPVSEIKTSGDAAKASANLAGTITPDMSGKDRALAQSYSAKLQKINTSKGTNELALANPEEALAYSRVQAQNKAVNHAIMMYIDPKGEVAYQRDLESGAIEATVNKLKADAAVSLKVLELLPEQMVTDRAKIAAEYARAQADLEVAKTGVDMAKVQLQSALADKDRAVAMAVAAGLDTSYAPVKDASTAVNDAYNKYVDYMRSLPKDKNGNPVPTTTNVTDLNILVDNYNDQKNRMNSLARSAGVVGWSDIGDLPQVTLVNKAWFQSVWGFITGKSYPSGIVPVEETAPSTSPVPAAAAPVPGKLTDSQLREEVARKASGLASKYGTY